MADETTTPETAKAPKGRASKATTEEVTMTSGTVYTPANG